MGEAWVIEVWGVIFDVLLLKEGGKACMAVLSEDVDSSDCPRTGLILPQQHWWASDNLNAGQLRVPTGARDTCSRRLMSGGSHNQF